MNINNEELSVFIKSDTVKWLQSKFKEKAEQIRFKPIDRKLPYIDQGLQSHAQELAADMLESFFIKLISDMRTKEFTKISYK